MPLRLCPDALLRLHESTWIASNPRLRHHVALDDRALAAVVRYATGASEATWCAELAGARGADRTVFAGAAGLWADQTGIGAGPQVGGDALFDVLRRRLFLIDEASGEYDAFIAPMQSVLDRNHLGTYHQRVGQHVLLDVRRANDWRWWHEQKFEPDGRAMLHGPYRDVEQFFFDGYFGARVNDEDVLDFACGNGHFSGRFARYGARVTGIDTSADLIALARVNHGAHAQFLAASDAADSIAAVEALAAASIDRIYLGDIVLLLMEDMDGFDRLLGAFRRALRPGGVIHTMEPNGAFWLAGRYGDPARPYAVIPEYRRPLYNVAPTVDRAVAAFARNGFALIELLHPAASPDADAAVRAFAAEFPLWDFSTYACR